MKGIPDKYLAETPCVVMDDRRPLGALLQQLAFRVKERDRLVVVIERAGEFSTFMYGELLEVDDELIDPALPIHRFMTLSALGTASVTINRREQGIRAAHDVMRMFRPHPVVVLDEGAVAGVLVDRVRQALTSGDSRLLETIREVVATPKWLSAQVHAGDEQRKSSFVAGASHRITVAVAPADRDWIQSDAELPTEDLPEGAPLDVLFWVEGGDDVQRATITLAATGRSDTCTFEALVPGDAERFSARLAVFNRCRLLQAAVLEGPVGHGGGDEGGGIELRRTQVSGSDPAHLRPFGASIHSERDRIVVMMCGIEKPVALGGLGEITAKIQNRLYNDVVGQARIEGDLSSRPARELLRYVAYWGNMLYRKLRDEAGPGLLDATAIEVTSAYPDDFFPAELVYDRGAPAEGAEICPNFGVSSAGDGDCPECPAYAPDGERNPYICPRGFWGLSKEIARRISAVADDDRIRWARLSASSKEHPSLAGLSSVLIGASTRVDAAGGASEIAATVAAAGELAGHVVDVSDWKGWASAVASDTPPTVLVAMSHTDRDRSIDADVLQIGKSSNIAVDEVTPGHVQRPPSEPGPIVLLLGCETAVPTIGFHGFIPAFLDRHAGVVIGTIAKVLGRHTAPVARDLLAQLKQAEGTDATITEVMRRVRTRMVADSNLMALTLAAYGDADWKIAPSNGGASGAN